MNKNTDALAKEYEHIRLERLKKIAVRDAELKEKGLPIGFDGPNYWKDIDDWYYEEIKNLKQKYGV